MDVEFKIINRAAPNGKRVQVWHYPSRAECMVCHSRAASYVLGLSEKQMHREPAGDAQRAWILSEAIGEAADRADSAK